LFRVHTSLMSEEAQIRQWVASVSTDQSATQGDISAALKSGLVLCKLVNGLKPGTILKVNEYTSAFRQAENIAAFTTAAKVVWGVPEADLFTPEDLQQSHNIPRVLLTLASLAQKNGALQSVNLEQLRQQANDQASKNPAAKKTAGAQLSLFEQGQARAQHDASKAATASRSRQIVQVEGGAGAQSTLSFAETQQAEAQKRSSDMNRTRGISRSGKHLGGFSMAETKQMQAQKLASGALVQTHNVARVGNDGAGAQGSFSIVEAKQMESQKLASGALLNKHNVARVGDEGAGSQGSFSIAEAKQMESQKLAHDTHTQANTMVRLPTSSGGPVVVSQQ